MICLQDLLGLARISGGIPLRFTRNEVVLYGTKVLDTYRIRHNHSLCFRSSSRATMSDFYPDDQRESKRIGFLRMAAYNHLERKISLAPGDKKLSRHPKHSNDG